MGTNPRFTCPPTWVAMLCVLCATTILGCGGMECFPVTGTVTLDGEPLADAKVSFMPDNELGTPTMGVTDQSGVYTLRQGADWAGAPAGSYTVRITTYREGQPEAEPAVAGVPEKVPPQYNLRTTLSAKVEPKENLFDFELSSKRK